jgi:hypothetical protein
VSTNEELKDLVESSTEKEDKEEEETQLQKDQQWECIRFKSFCIFKETINIMKRLFAECEKIFSCCSLDKGLMIRIWSTNN